VGAAFEGASLQAFAGAESVPGLSAFARRLPAPPPPATDIAPSGDSADGEGGPEIAPPPEAAFAPLPH
jgi:hypothetical protein